MKGFMEEYGKIILAAVCFGLCIVMITGIFNDTSTSGIKGYITQKFANISEETNKSAGTNASYKNYKAPTIKGSKDLILLKREKPYSITYGNGPVFATDFVGSEFFMLNEMFNKKYILLKANENQPFYITTPNITVNTTNISTTPVDITKDLYVDGSFKSPDGIKKAVGLIKFKRNSDGSIATYGGGVPKIEKYTEVLNLELHGKVSDYAKEFDAITILNPGKTILYYSVRDAKDFVANTRVQILVEECYGDGPDAQRIKVWEKF